MIARHLGPAVLGAVLLVVPARSAELSPAPAGHVLDASDTLGERRRAALEAELSRVRNAHQIDILAVVWDRDPPTEGELASLAAELGAAWARESAWVVVIQVPTNGGTLSGAHRGFFPDGETGIADAALEAGIARGRREWNAPARLAASALECGEEFTFLRYAHPRVATPLSPTIPPTEVTGSWDNLVVRLAVACAAVLLLGLAAFAWSLRSRRRETPTTHHFPETDRKRRFGAPWSGGSDLTVTYPTTTS